MKRGTFKKLTYQEAIEKQRNTPPRGLKLTSKRTKTPKRDLMPQRVKRAKLELVILSHTFVRSRDSMFKSPLQGRCFTCNKVCSGGDFQAGHWEPDSTGGVLLRYHPLNMNGQGGYCCNINRHGQQRIANEYTLKMIEKHGLEKVNALRRLKQKSIKADILFYEKMLELYKTGDEQKVIDYLENLC